MRPPFILVDDLDIQFFPSLDKLLGQVEAIDVRDGVYEVFDGEGRSIELTAVSDTSRVTAAPGPPAGDRLKDLLTKYVSAVGTTRFGIPDIDVGTVDLAWLVRSVGAYQSGGRSPRW